MDFDNGVDSIEFLIQSFGYDEIDVLEQTEEEDVIFDHSHGQIRLIDVNATGTGTDMFTFGMAAVAGARLNSD